MYNSCIGENKKRKRAGDDISNDDEEGHVNENVKRAIERIRSRSKLMETKEIFYTRGMRQEVQA